MNLNQLVQFFLFLDGQDGQQDRAVHDSGAGDRGKIAHGTWPTGFAYLPHLFLFFNRCPRTIVWAGWGGWAEIESLEIRG